MKFPKLLKSKTNHSLIVNVPKNLSFSQILTISSTTRINFLHKLEEAMFVVVLPDIFKKFQPNFKFVATEKTCSKIML